MSFILTLDFLSSISPGYTNKSIQSIRSAERSQILVSTCDVKEALHMPIKWRSPNLHVGQVCLYPIGAYNPCIRQYALIHCIYFIINTLYIKIIIWHHIFSAVLERGFKKPWLCREKIVPMFTKFEGATKEAEERPQMGSVWPTYSMVRLSGSIVTLSVHFVLDFIWIFKVTIKYLKYKP